MMKKITAVLLAMLILTLVASAQENAQHTLEKLLLGKSIQLRTPCDDANLQFDQQGKLLSSAQPSPWTVDGVFLVDTVSLKNGTLEISGKRILVALKLESKPSLLSLQTKRTVKFTVTGLPSDATSDQILAVLGHILVGGNLHEHMANFWKASIDISQSMEQMRRQSPDGIVAHYDQDRPVFLVGPPYKVKPPKVLRAPSPDYGESALYAEGVLTEVRVVVNENGRPELVGLTRDTKGDLGVRTVMAVAQWKFSPAIKDGIPVASFISVETEFHSQ